MAWRRNETSFGASTDRPFRTLLADDSSSFRAFASALLEASGEFEVVGEAADGAEAVRLAKEHHPYLLLLDVRMPHVDGIQATPMIRASCPETKVVWLSGLSASEAGIRAADLGAAGYLEKTLPPNELLAKLLDICTAR